MQKIILITLLYSLLPTILSGQTATETTFHEVEENLMAQFEAYPQEKIHLHTDRDFYVPGEKIWFKAYVTDAATHQYPTYSRYVYAELIDSRDSLVSRVMIRPTDDMFYGHLFLSEIIPAGNYTLRAYTRYMENLGDDYFFKKNIRIGNLPSDKKQPSKTKRENRKGKTEKDDFEVSFFPEGGNLPEGILCKVAFKALNRNGYPETVSGEVVDETGSEIATVTTFHAGMGMFCFIPEQDQRYYLKCRNANGLEKQFEVPHPTPRAYSLTTTWRDKKLLVGIQKSIHSPDIPCYLLVHCRGMALYFSAWDKEKEFITFAEEQFPAGIIQCVLFDEQMNPLSERLVFNKNDDEVTAGFHTDKAIYETRENVISTLSLTDSGGYPLSGHLSVAITDDKDVAVDSTTTILSSLLLSSELKGYIENPAWYLRDNIESTTALDYLMMTHGWRRYNIPEIVKGNPAYPTIPFQASQEISGEVKTLLRSKPVTDSKISLLMKGGDFGIATTDEKGRFTFHDIEYPDSTTYFIQARSKKGSDRVKLVLNEESFPALIYAQQTPVAEIPVIGEETKDVPKTNAFIAKAEQRSKYDEDMRVIHLSEVLVTARRIEKRDEPRLQYWQNENSDVTIRREEFEKSPPMYVSDLLRRVAGVRVYPNGIVTIREGRGLPLVLIDGVSYDWPDMHSPYDSPINTLPVSFVESLDIFKGATSAIFGMRGMYGVISITTRRGGSNSELEQYNYAIYNPVGYQKPVEFYSPRYETVEAKQSSMPDYRTTIFWKPDVVISDAGEASFDFYTSDFPTTYSVVIEGLTTDGRIIRRVEKIEVK